MNILFENEICDFLRLPSIPKKEWDKKSEVESAVAVVRLFNGEQAYAAASCKMMSDGKVDAHITKTFAAYPFTDIVKVYVVPSYMGNTPVENMDLDDASKKRAQELVNEAMAIEEEENIDVSKTPEHEYFFDFINDDEEAIAFIQSYNKKNRIRGGVPRKHEAIVLRLGVIWAEQNKK